MPERPRCRCRGGANNGLALMLKRCNMVPEDAAGENRTTTDEFDALLSSVTDTGLITKTEPQALMELWDSQVVRALVESREELDSE